MQKSNLFIMLILALSCPAVASDAVWLQEFSGEMSKVPAPWQLIQLDKKVVPTRYQISNWEGVLGIEAIAQHSMSLLARPVTVDLHQTPVLCWRWRIDAPLRTADMAKKSGDDYAARVYVSFTLPASEMGLFTRAKLKLARSIYGDAVPDAAINYVWDNRYPVGTRMPNAYTDRTRMIVAESGAVQAGKWVEARHDVLLDVIAEFGTGSARVIQLSVASDTDNTGETAHAGFADFHFVEKEATCLEGQAGNK